MAPSLNSAQLVCPRVALSPKRVLIVGLALVLLMAALPTTSYSQSATTGLITGVVSDPTGAVVPGATVSLHQNGTNVVLTTVTDSAGRYSFPAVDPGDYTLRLTAKGFATEVASVHVEVLKSVTVNLTLKMGEASQTVEVTEESNTELQTTDSSIGNVLSGEGLARLPAYTRSATSLIFLQPGVTPPSPSLNSAVSDVYGGQIAGSRSEQVTFSLDGGDATSDIEGSDSYANPPGEPQPAPVIPTPLESTQEFGVTSSNPNATLNRSSGGQVALVTKHGTNAWHGSGYEYHADDALGANSWLNDGSGVAKPHQVDNRFGGTVGGPIWKDRFFFFANYEGRRLHDAASEVAIVPTASLKSGALSFPTGINATGTAQSYNLNPANGALASVCGPSGSGPCDPRGIGFSPAVAAQFALYPTGNCNALGDGLNTTGYCYSVATPVQADLGVLRLDYRINNKWSAFATYHVSRLTQLSQKQLDILDNKSLSNDPINGAYDTVELTGQLTPQLTSSTHGSYLKNWWGWNRIVPAPLVSGANTTVQALMFAGEGKGNQNTPGKLLADPINIDTQNGRARVWDGHDWYIAQDFSWQRGHHLLQFGGSGYLLWDYHFRTDDVVGGLTSAPVDYIEANPGNGSALFATVGSAYEPVPCAAAGSTNCLPPADALNWDVLYASVLGMVDHSAQVETRNASFQPNPLGSGLFDHVYLPAFYTYFQDVWQVRPSLTVTAGLNWGVQLSPNESAGKETVWAYADSQTPVDFWQYVDNRKTAFAQGQIVNPTLGIMPVNSLAAPFHGLMRRTTWHDVGPRVSVAWQVPFHNWFFGNNATVIRGGYALVFDRAESVGAVLNPLLSGGLADVDQCGGPVSSGGGAVCTNAGTDPTTAFRIGVDGNSVPVPAPTAVPTPFVPRTPLFLAGPLDPYATPAHAHSVDFTVQRALPGKMFLEVGYIGKFSRNLPQGLNFMAADYLAKDPASGQTLAQAFDALAAQINAGTAPGSVTPQPFFENVGGGCGVGNSCTRLLAGNPAAAGALGIEDLNGLMPVFDGIVAHPLDQQTVTGMAGLTDKGFSTYNAGFVNLNKNFSNGLQMQFNWTWAHALGNQGLNQNQDYTANSPFNLNLDKSSEVFDRKHTINLWWYYTLPFGRGGKYLSGNGALNQIVGGWYTSGIYTYATGLPTYIGGDCDYGGSSVFFLDVGCAADFSKPIHGLEGLHGDGTAAGPNLFADPAAVYDSLSRPLISVDNRVHFDELRTLPTWNFDLSVGKEVVKTERFKATFSADFLNAFNHPWLGTDPTTLALDLLIPPAAGFGSISHASNLPRRILLGLRFDF